MQQLGFSLIIKINYVFDDIFIFYLFESFQRGVLYSHDMYLLILLFTYYSCKTY